MNAFFSGKHIRNVARLLLAATAFVASPTAVWRATGTRLEARLTGNTAASGKVKFEARNARRKFSVEVERAGRDLPLQILVRRGPQTWLVANSQTNNVGRSAP